MGSILGGFLTGGPVGAILGFAKSLLSPLEHIFNKIETTKVQLAQADNEDERIRLTAKLGALQTKAQMLATESRYTRMNVYIRSAAASGPIFLVTKIMVWDKALGQWTHGHTDALSSHQWYIIYMVYGLYFLHEIAGTWNKKAA